MILYEKYSCTDLYLVISLTCGKNHHEIVRKTTLKLNLQLVKRILIFLFDEKYYKLRKILGRFATIRGRLRHRSGGRIIPLKREIFNLAWAIFEKFPET